MLSFEQMALRLVIALVLGALIGLERELIGKEAGVRTGMLVAGGAAIFSMIAVMLPGLLALDSQNLADILGHNGGFLTIIANIVLGVGFLGAGTIVKSESHVHGLTTAALIWATAAIGTLAGLGITRFAFFAAIVIAGLLYLLRNLDLGSSLRSNGS